MKAKKLKKIIVFFLIFPFFYISKANQIGFCLKGNWGLNLYGLSNAEIYYDKILTNKDTGTDEKKTEKIKSSPRIGQLVGAGAGIQYSFGKDREEIFFVSLDLLFSRRETGFMFKTEDSTKVENHYSDILKVLSQDCIDTEISFYLNLYPGKWVNFGFHLGFGIFYALSQSISDHDLVPTNQEIVECSNSLNKFNLYPLGGINLLFLDKILQTNLTYRFTLLDQLKKNINPLKDNYGSKICVGKDQLSFSFSISINIWELVTG